MNRIAQMCTLTIVIAVVSQGVSHAAIITPGDFNGNEVVQDFNILPVTLGQATPFVFSGNTYQVDGNSMNIGNSGTLIGTTGIALQTRTDLGFIDITLGTAVNRAGAYTGTTSDWTATATFFDELDTLIGTVNVAGTANSNQFAGFEATSGLIQRIRFDDTSLNLRVLFLDDLTTEIDPLSAIPEPSTIAIWSVLGLVGAGVQMRRKRKAA